MFEEVGNFVIDSTGETMRIVRTKGGVSIMPLDDFRWAWGQHNPEKWKEKNRRKNNRKQVA